VGLVSRRVGAVSNARLSSQMMAREWLPDLSGNLADGSCREGRAPFRHARRPQFGHGGPASPPWRSRDPSFARQSRARFPDKSGNRCGWCPGLPGNLAGSVPAKPLGPAEGQDRGAMSGEGSRSGLTRRHGVCDKLFSPRGPTRDPSFARRTRARFSDKSGNPPGGNHAQ